MRLDDITEDVVEVMQASGVLRNWMHRDADLAPVGLLRALSDLTPGRCGAMEQPLDETSANGVLG